VAVYANATELLNLFPAVSPELAIIDAGLDISFQFLADVILAAPNCKFVLLARTATAELLYHAREAGASALLPTSLTPDRLLSSLDRVQRGESIFDSVLRSDDASARALHLTRRESQLVELVSKGLKNKEIATCLGIVEGTVKVYLSKLFQKVGANDRLELALFGLKNTMSQVDVVPDSELRRVSQERPHLPVGGPKILFRRPPDPLRVALR
jgi:DNA-binding NarL/FixJ family response regulator